MLKSNGSVALLINSSVQSKKPSWHVEPVALFCCVYLPDIEQHNGRVRNGALRSGCWGQVLSPLVGYVIWGKSLNPLDE